MRHEEQNELKGQDTNDPALNRDLNNIEAGDDALIFITVAFLILVVLMYTLVFGA